MKPLDFIVTFYFSDLSSLHHLAYTVLYFGNYCSKSWGGGVQTLNDLLVDNINSHKSMDNEINKEDSRALLHGCRHPGTPGAPDLNLKRDPTRDNTEWLTSVTAWINHDPLQSTRDSYPSGCQCADTPTPRCDVRCCVLFEHVRHEEK